MIFKYRGGQLCPMAWSSISPNGNFSMINVSIVQLWMPAHSDYSTINVEKRSEWVKAMSDLNHFRLDHLYSDVQSDGRPLPLNEINYLFHYIDDSVVVLEQHFDRRLPDAQLSNSFITESISITSAASSSSSQSEVNRMAMTSTLSEPIIAIPKKRYRYVLFANLGNQTVVRDFSDKFHFSITQLATNTNRTSEFLMMRTLQLEPGEAMIATVE
ncbi:hypothetical protein BLOT_011019 [Blomia tropicalis]|nr:hypothetical protein BLOT_011019 [Blomia tropicalis]